MTIQEIKENQLDLYGNDVWPKDFDVKDLLDEIRIKDSSRPEQLVRMQVT